VVVLSFLIERLGAPSSLQLPEVYPNRVTWLKLFHGAPTRASYRPLVSYVWHCIVSRRHCILLHFVYTNTPRRRVLRFRAVCLLQIFNLMPLIVHILFVSCELAD
jgi:hypothetical protein